jgi:hypothetical protein
VYARVTLLEIDTARIGMDEALERFRCGVLPVLQEQPGYEGVYVLTTDDGKGVLLSLWDTEEDADAGVASGYYGDQIEKFITMFRSPPGREHYRVALVDQPDLAWG